jgi:Sulfotransferase family
VARVLVVGVPRSGTTWAATVLGQTGRAAYVEEPDNHFRFAFGYRAKRLLGQGEFPSPRDRGAAAYTELWDQAFTTRARPQRAVERWADRAANRVLAAEDVGRISGALRGGRPTLALRAAEALAVPRRPAGPAEHVVVKSVYAQLALEWIVERWPCSVVVVVRNPLAILSSWVQLRWLTHPTWEPLDALDPHLHTARSGLPPAPPSRLARSAWLVGFLTHSLQSALAQHPEWHVVSHEALCARPVDRFRELADRVDLEWNAEAEATLVRLDRPGSGHDVARVAADADQAWRSRLDATQVEEIEAVLRQFPIGDWAALR